ncbi:MAG: hypothetical protein HYV27_06245 [Candidatus Hydrogenedentes bacterium]|nr:hypothetical protein [Candidatus Hydrogenedentota bacterium]
MRQALSRLSADGRIRRVMHGVYDYPAYSRVRQGPASPNPDAIARAIARAHGWTLVPSGETALNLLGLSTQVPARWLYFSDGPTKTYEWEGGALHFRRRTNKETGKLSPKTALLVQALKALGEAHVDEWVLETLRSRLTAKERARAFREARYVTAWVYAIIKRLAIEGDAPDA